MLTEKQIEHARQAASDYAARFEKAFREREVRRAEDRKQWVEVTIPLIMRRAARDRRLKTA